MKSSVDKVAMLIKMSRSKLRLENVAKRNTRLNVDALRKFWHSGLHCGSL
jgi:hypothetical protein